MSGPNRRVALISMPWCSAWMPSVQLNILRQCLSGRTDNDSYELYLDYAAAISPRLYRILSEAGGMIEEWLFAKNYFEPEGIAMREGFLVEMPEFEVGDRAKQQQLVEALVPVTGDFLERIASTIDWGRYDIVAFTLSIYQTAASMALARLIKRRFPHVKVVLGGNSCVGPSARALMEICPYIDVVVRSEAEPTFAALVERLFDGRPLNDVRGLVFRSTDGVLAETGPAALYHPARTLALPNYDAFFERFERLKIDEPDKIWLPFESSRGCWWGEKSHCTFCGLHEIMKYRARNADDVLEELDYLYSRYAIPRFFATDLILPQEYYRTFLPRLAERNYQFFYELKGNVRRESIRKLRDAGVTHVQPGLESLSSEVLRLMRKGLAVSQGVEFLRWCGEYDITIGWNVIAGMPGEDPEWNRIAAERARHMHHLQPPHFINFELNRYSPIFKDPEAHQLSNISPLGTYRWIFPIAENLLNDLVYRFEYDTPDFAGRPPWLGGNAPPYAVELREAVREWRIAYRRGAKLIARLAGDGGLTIVDSRDPDNPREIALPPVAASLYRALDRHSGRTALLDKLAENSPDLFPQLGGREIAEAWLELWREDGLILVDGDVIVALALFENDEARMGREASTLVEVPNYSALTFAASPIAAQPAVSTRNAQLLRFPDNTVVFAKKVDPRYSESEGEICNRLAALATRAGFASPAPRFLGVYEEYGLCFEALTSHQSWAELINDGRGLNDGVVVSLAAELAALHRLTPVPGSADESYFAGHGPDAEARVRTYDAITLSQFAMRPGIDYDRFLECAQSATAELLQLRARWAPTSLIHGDCKPDNVLVPADQKARVRLVDWELCGLGDPLYDLGAVLGGMVTGWIGSVASTSATTLAQLFGSASTSSAQLARTANTFVRAYAAASEIVEVARIEEGAWRYAGQFMLEIGYVANATMGRMPLTALLTTELGTRLLKEPLVLSAAWAPALRACA